MVTVGLYGNLLGTNSCPASNVGVRASLLGLIKVCACVNVLNPGSGSSACPACPAHASPVCGGSGTCACQCNSGFYATSSGTCIANSRCPAPNTLTSTSTSATCICAAGYISDGAGGCVLTPSARVRAARHRRSFPMHHGQAVFAPSTSESRAPAFACPDNETACPLQSGGFECIDTSSSLSACGGCVGLGQSGQNCLAIPGALNVQCLDSKCHVGSCFKGWTHTKDGNGSCI